MQAAFVVLLDSPSYNYVRNLQLKIYNLYGAKEPLKLEPHFTIKYAFDTNNLTGVENYFDDLVSKTKKFEVVLEGINSFESKVIFLDVRKNDLLTDLHLNLLKDLSEKFSMKPSEFEGKDLHFHVTLAYKDINDETFHKIKKLLKDESPNFKFEVKRLGLYLLPNPDQQWFIYKIGNLS